MKSLQVFLTLSVLPAFAVARVHHRRNYDHGGPISVVFASSLAASSIPSPESSAATSSAAPVCVCPAPSATSSLPISGSSAPVPSASDSVSSSTPSPSSALVRRAWPLNLSSARSSFRIIKGSVGPLENEDGSTVLVGKYPKGSYAGGSKGGFNFDAKTDVNLDNAKEAVLSYDIKFQAGFGWAEGGKIPGMFGGDNDQIGGTCSGGRHNDRCWSARMMWRDGGRGELYGYFPSANKGRPFCKGHCGSQYGASLDTGAWRFSAGKWTTLTERVKLNDLNKGNGEIEIFVNGKSVIRKTGITLRTSQAGRIRGVMMHTFFGGSSSSIYQSPKYQETYFRNFKMQVTETLDGHVSSPNIPSRPDDDDEEEKPEDDDDKPTKTTKTTRPTSTARPSPTADDDDEEPATTRPTPTADDDNDEEPATTHKSSHPTSEPESPSEPEPTPEADPEYTPESYPEDSPIPIPTEPSSVIPSSVIPSDVPAPSCVCPSDSVAVPSSSVIIPSSSPSPSSSQPPIPSPPTVDPTAQNSESGGDSLNSQSAGNGASPLVASWGLLGVTLFFSILL